MKKASDRTGRRKYVLVSGIILGFIQAVFFITFTLITFQGLFLFAYISFIILVPLISAYNYYSNMTNDLANQLKFTALILNIISVALLLLIIMPYYGT